MPSGFNPLLILCFVTVLVPNMATAGDDACSEGARINYPLSAVMELQAVELSVAEYLLPGPDDLTSLSAKDSAARRRQAVIDALEGLSAIEADARLLALLSYDTQGKSAAINLTVLSPSALIDDYIALLDRRGLPDHAAVLRRAKALFPLWGEDPEQRYLLWSDGYGTILSPTLDAGLEEASADFLSARPEVLQAAVSLAKTDPDYLERLEAQRGKAPDDQRLSYLMGLIWACSDGNWWTPAEADAAFSSLPRTQRDLLLADLLMAEVFNGGVHQYFTNSSGTMAPETAEVLDRLGLGEHASALRGAMALYGPTYPRDTNSRREIMRDWTAAQDEALNIPTGIFDDGQVTQAMIDLARREGLLPR